MPWLVDIKFITLFSLLPGLGFAVQLERAQRCGTGAADRTAGAAMGAGCWCCWR